MKIKKILLLATVFMLSALSVFSQIEWVPFNGELPSNAVIGGVETHRSLAVCRCEYKKGIHPGKVVEKACNIGWGGKEVKVEKFEVLVNNGVVELDWIKTNGTLPEHAIQGGKENGKPIYIGRKFYDNGTHPGKVFKVGRRYICNIGWGGKEIVNRKFEVLVENKSNSEAARITHDPKCKFVKKQPTYFEASFIGNMSKNNQLNEGSSLVSNNLQYQTRVTDDGRLVVEEIQEKALCNDSRILIFKTNEIWSNTTEGKDAKLDYYLKLQEDGNLCIYSEQKGFVWCSMSNGSNANHLELTNIGHIEIVNDHGGEVWPD